MSIYFRRFFIVKSSIYDSARHDFGLRNKEEHQFLFRPHKWSRHIDKNLILSRNVRLLFPQNQTIQERAVKGIKTWSVAIERDSQNQGIWIRNSLQYLIRLEWFRERNLNPFNKTQFYYFHRPERPVSLLVDRISSKRFKNFFTDLLLYLCHSLCHKIKIGRIFLGVDWWFRMIPGN